MEIEIGYRLSPLAQAYVRSRATMIRDSDRTCGSEALTRLLQAHGLPVSREILDFEANLGGWCSSHSLSVSGYGVYLSLQDGDEVSLVSRELREREWLFEGQRDAVDEEGETSPLWGTGYPRAFFIDRPLVPGGMLGLDVHYFLGTGGEIYCWSLPLDMLEDEVDAWIAREREH